jgi:hypothetical protein
MAYYDEIWGQVRVISGFYKKGGNMVYKRDNPDAF